MDYGEGVPGDGRCLFRSVVHGAWLRAGKPSPSESLQKELADELRTKVADEFIKRRADTEWFVEGDFDTYVVQMRQPHIWGGEPELLMSSHVLKMPITVYMWEKNSGSLKIIAEYGQEYGKENPIRVLYHGYGHYDVLRSPVGGAPSKQCLDSLKAKGGGDADYRLDALPSSKDAIAGKYLKPLGDDEDSVDQKAERFIQRFYKEMRM